MIGKEQDKSGPSAGTGKDNNNSGGTSGAAAPQNGGSRAKRGAQAKGVQKNQNQKQGAQQQNGNAANGGQTDPIALVKEAHNQIREMISACESAEEAAKGDKLDELLREWANHARLEEEVFVPVAQQGNVDSAMLDKLQVERDLGKVL